MHRDAIGVAAIAMSATAVCAQTDATFLLTSSNTVSPATPTTMIEVWATWVDPSAQYLFGGTNYDLEAGDGVFVSGTLAFGASPPLSVGVLNGRKVIGAVLGKGLICSPLPCPYENPILLATYEWTTTDFTARVVELKSMNTNNFVVGIPVVLPNSPIPVQMYPNEFTHGSGVIKVVPAPAAWLALALPLVAPCRRRRC